MARDRTANSVLSLLLAGEPTPFVPVEPLYGWPESLLIELRWQKWSHRLREAGTERLAVDYRTYFEVEAGVYADLLDACYPPPVSIELPVVKTAHEVAGCAVERRDDALFWLDPDGEATWLPPDGQAASEARVADRSEKLATVWESHLDQYDTGDGGGREAPPSANGTPVQAAEVEAMLASGRYRLAQELPRRFAGKLGFHLWEYAPYENLLKLGFQGMMEAFVERPKLVHRLLEEGIPQRSASLEAAYAVGVRVIFLEETLSSADVISPAMYREFSLPYAKRALEFYRDQGFFTIYYFTGNLMPLLGDLRELPFDALAFEEDRKGYGIDLAKVRRIVGSDRVLFGNIDALFLETASDRELLLEVRRQIAVGGPADRFVVSTGSPLTPRTTRERLRFFVESTRSR